MVLKGLGLFSEMVAEWSPSLLDALAPPVSCVKASAQMGRTRKQPRAFDWKDLEKQKWVMLPITKILHTWFSASLTKLENKSTVYISGRWFKKKKEKRRAEIFHAGEHGDGISPQQGDKLALRCLTPFSRSPFFLSLTYPRAARAQGTRGTGWGPGLPLAQTGQQAVQGPATKALPGRKAAAASSWVSRQTPA